jgi:hypothetical protein
MLDTHFRATTRSPSVPTPCARLRVRNGCLSSREGSLAAAIASRITVPVWAGKPMITMTDVFLWTILRIAHL